MDRINQAGHIGMPGAAQQRGGLGEPVGRGDLGGVGHARRSALRLRCDFDDF
jgi:hypothetical protein